MKNEKSCGTITINNNKVLLVQQNSLYFGFPKGHMEDGETEIETALRETKEETNIDVIIDENKRFSVSYIQKETINKEVVYFLAKPINDEILAQEGEILSVCWVDIDKVYDMLAFEDTKKLWCDVLNEIKK